MHHKTCEGVSRDISDRMIGSVNAMCATDIFAAGGLTKGRSKKYHINGYDKYH
jgi:hypothetical protein